MSGLFLAAYGQGVIVVLSISTEMSDPSLNVNHACLTRMYITSMEQVRKMDEVFNSITPHNPVDSSISDKRLELELEDARSPHQRGPAIVTKK
jgi:hypothetical protein